MGGNQQGQVRTMVCPYCGHECQTRRIGAVYCGPHGTGVETTPAVRMLEIQVWRAEEHVSELEAALRREDG